jgi:hypothetical protein
MKNESHSLMHGADFGGDNAKTRTWSVATEQLEQLQLDNARLRAIVAELLLKNQTLRWQMNDHQSLEMLLSGANEYESEG